MGRKRRFGITLYKKIQREGEVPCIEKDSSGRNCPGVIKYVREREEPVYEEVSQTKTFFYRCTRNCRHRWKVIRNNLDRVLDFEKY